VRPGRDVRILNVSRGGAAVEANARLLPGSIVEVQVTGRHAGWIGSARVLRCSVSALMADTCVRYRAGLEFRVPLDDEAEARLLSACREAPGEGGDGYQLPQTGSCDT